MEINIWSFCNLAAENLVYKKDSKKKSVLKVKKIKPVDKMEEARNDLYNRKLDTYA